MFLLMWANKIVTNCEEDSKITYLLFSSYGEQMVKILPRD